MLTMLTRFLVLCYTGTYFIDLLINLYFLSALSARAKIQGYYLLRNADKLSRNADNADSSFTKVNKNNQEDQKYQWIF